MSLFDSTMEELGLPSAMKVPRAKFPCETMLAVPDYWQLRTYSCGEAVAISVVKCFHKASSKEVAKSVGAHHINGTSTTKLVRALRQWDIGVSERYDLEVADIKQSIEDGFPVISCIHTKREGEDHWVVLYGFTSTYLIVGGNNVKQRIRNSEFRRLWAPEGFGLICWGK